MNLALDCGVAEELGSQPLSGPGAKHLNDDAIARDAECDAVCVRQPSNGSQAHPPPHGGHNTSANILNSEMVPGLGRHQNYHTPHMEC